MFRVFIVGFLIIPTLICGQKISFNSEFKNSNHIEIIQIREFWKSYIKDISASNSATRQNVFTKYWNKEELNLGFTDIVNDELPVYSLGELTILSIDNLNNGYYNIKNKVVGNSNNDPVTVYAIFNICAKKDSSGYKLYNYFNLNKPSLLHSRIGEIDYYYPMNFAFNSSKATETANFYSKISSIYSGNIRRNLTYIIANNFNEANNLIGFDQSIVTSSSPYAGYSIKNQGIILSCRIDHFHEIVHSVFFSRFPNTPALFNEGIATYYGGTGGFTLPSLISQFKEYIKNNPQTNLSNLNNLDQVKENRTNNFYILGAILVDYAIKNGGPQKIINIFNHSSDKQLSSDDPWQAIENELGIKKDQFDTFIKKYIDSL